MITSDSPSPADDSLEELVGEFEELEDWDERYEFLIDLGKQLPALEPELQLDSNKVEGCMSTVWIVTEIAEAAPNQVMQIKADSDSIMVKGLITVILAAFDGKPLQTIRELDIENVFRRMGLEQHLTPNRRNGLHAMVNRIRRSIP